MYVYFTPLVGAFTIVSLFMLLGGLNLLDK
jgi:hypothetical protein